MSTPRPLLIPSGYPVTPWCELGVGDSRVPTGAARWDIDLWDDAEALWAGTEPTWLDVSCEVIAATSTAGRVRIIDAFTIGSSEITFRNRDGWADLTGRPFPPAELPLRPGRQIRWGVDTPAGRHVLHRGYVDVADPTYRPYGDDTVTITSVDALGEAGRVKLARLGAAVGDGETATARITRLLDAARWPATMRDLDPTGGRVLATLLGDQVANLLGVTADSVGGSVFGGLDGRVVFRHRDWQTYVPGTPVDGTIGNVDAGDVCPSAWDLSWARSDVAAVVRMATTAGLEATATDQTALIAIGPEPFERADLISYTVGDLQTLANRALRTRGINTMPCVQGVALDAAYDPGDGSYAELMATARPEIPTRLRCRLVDSGRDVFDDELFVTATAHTITSTGRWWTELGLDVAAPFAAVGGRWDAAWWDQALWSDVAALAAEARGLIAELQGATP